MKGPLHFTAFFLIWLFALIISPARSEHILLRDVLSESGGRAESSDYLLDYSVGQVAVGPSMGSDHIEWGGFWGWSPWQIFAPVEEGTRQSLPDGYVLHQNYPNPFNPETKISYQLPGFKTVSLVIYNVKGQVVRRLVHEDQIPGVHEVVWNGTDQWGRVVSSGVYFYQLTAGQFHQMRKMLLLK
jgi:hypothetical protein